MEQGDTLLHPPLRVFLEEGGGRVSKQDAYASSIDMYNNDVGQESALNL